MSKTVGGNTTQFTWDVASGLPLLLGDGSSNWIYGPGGLPLEQVTGSTPLWFHHDQLGSTRMLTDAAGSMQGTYTLDAYGNSVVHTGTASTPLQFSGEYLDQESGLYYLRARYYDPSTAQFISRDPIAAITPYPYASDNPTNRRDPSGLWTLGLCLNGAAAFGLHGSLQGCVVTANFQELGLTATPGAGGGSPSAGASLGLQGSNGNRVADLNGPFAYAGGSAGTFVGPAVGAEGFAGYGTCNQPVYGSQVSLGLGAEDLLPFPIPFEFHGGVSYTWSAPAIIVPNRLRRPLYYPPSFPYI